MTHVPTWMDLENKKVKQASHKISHIAWFHLYEMSRRGKFIETGSWGKMESDC